MTFSEYCIFKWRNFAESLEKVWRKLWENDISLNFSLQIPSKYPKFFGLHDFWPDFLNFGSTVYKRRVWAPWTCMKHRFRTKKKKFLKISGKYEENHGQVQRKSQLATQNFIPKHGPTFLDSYIALWLPTCILLSKNRDYTNRNKAQIHLVVFRW